MRKTAYLLIVLMLLSVGVFAAAPEKVEQAVVNLILFDGSLWKNTISPQEYKTFYMMANADNILVPTNTKVYFWPITQEYMADFYDLNEEIEGTMVVSRGNRVIARIEKEEYAFAYPNGYYTGSPQLVRGEEAHKASAQYKDEVNAYYQRVMEYQQALVDYQVALEKFWENPEAYRGRESEIPKEPKIPEYPTYYATEVQRGYIVNLEPGTYTIEIEGMPETKRTAIAFTPRRQGVGYDIRPEQQWTVPRPSNDRSETVYVYGKQTIYVTPYKGIEVNHFMYEKLKKLPSELSGRGGELVYKWMALEYLNGGTLEVYKDGELISTSDFKQWYVDQTAGAALGYNIIEFDPKVQGERPPSFEGFRVQLEGSGRYSFRLVDKEGNVVQESERLIRSIDSRSRFFAVILPIVPILIGGLIWVWRASLSATDTGTDKTSKLEVAKS